MYRQGDVMIRQINEIPKGTEEAKPDGNRIVLAYGEVTGHAHAIAVPQAKEFTLRDAGIAVRRFLQVFEGGAEVKHEEHATIPLPTGFYEIVQQREYSPEEIRNVAD